MAVTYSDIITDESVRREVLREIQHPLRFRQIFSQIDISNEDGDSIKLPRELDKMGEPDEVGYGSEFPRDKEGMEMESVSVKKYGMETELWEEAVQDSMFDVISENVGKMGRRMNEFLDRKSFEFIRDNHHATEIDVANTGTTTGLDFESVVEGKKVLQDEGYQPDFLITSTQGEKDLVLSDEFQRATDLGDNTVRTGQIGRVAGMDVVTDTSGRLDNNTSEAYLLDTDEYGWEIVKEDINTDSYVDDSTHSQIYQIWTRRGWYTPRTETAVYMG